MNIINSLEEIDPKRYKAVIFDCYGTLVEIQEKTHPYKFLYDTLIAQGHNFDNYKHFVMSQNKTLTEWVSEKSFSLSQKHQDQFYDLLNVELNSIKLFPETYSVIRALRHAKVMTLICSNLAKPYGKALMSLPVDKAILSYEVGYLKPDEKIFQLCHQHIGLEVLKKDILFVGDTPSSDYQGALNYGFDAQLIKR